MLSILLDTLDGLKEVPAMLEPWGKFIGGILGVFVASLIPAASALSERKRSRTTQPPETLPDSGTTSAQGTLALAPHMSLYVDAKMAETIGHAITTLAENVKELCDGLGEHRQDVRRLKDEVEAHGRQTEGCIDACDALRRELHRGSGA